jgi:hypothetical protein
MALVCTNCKQVVTEKIDPTTGMPIAVWVCENCGEENHTEDQVPAEPVPVISNFVKPSVAPMVTPITPPIVNIPVEPPAPVQVAAAPDPEPVAPDLAAAQAEITAAAAALTPDPIPPVPPAPVKPLV